MWRSIRVGKLQDYLAGYDDLLTDIEKVKPDSEKVDGADKIYFLGKKSKLKKTKYNFFGQENKVAWQFVY